MTVHLPVAVALARQVYALPEQPGLVYEPKFDGHRGVLSVVAGGPVLQAGRSGRDVSRAFPELVGAAERLPVGVVLDGEIVVYTRGAVDFTAVQRRALSAPRRSAALARELPAHFAAFDVLAAPGGEDLRGRPYRERREELLRVVGVGRPPIQPVPATEDVVQARVWLEQLPAVGIEGLVIKSVDGAYPSGRRGWWKIRHSVPGDAVVLGWTGPARRPDRLVVQLAGDGEPALLSAPLAPDVSAAVGSVTTARSAGAVAVLPDGTRYQVLSVPVSAEVSWGTTRHGHVVVHRVVLGV